MVSKNKKRVMITLSNYVLNLLDKIVDDTGESYSEFITRVVISNSLERNKN